MTFQLYLSKVRYKLKGISHVATNNRVHEMIIYKKQTNIFTLEVLEKA